MTFSRQVVDDMRPEFGKGGSHRGPVADVGLQEAEVLSVGGLPEGGKLSRIGQPIDAEHSRPVGHERTHERRADESGAAGDDNSLLLPVHSPLPCEDATDHLLARSEAIVNAGTLARL